VGLLLEPIKKEFHLSDTQLGLLTGMSFGIFYATMGVPIARWADRGNRATITSIAMALWGMTVMSCLLVTNFAQLILTRIAAAVGEAGCMPPTYSLLGDYFPAPAERSKAMAIYWLASPLSPLLSYVGGAWLYEVYGWRMTFFLMGIPALVVAALTKLTVTEPRMRLQREVRISRPAVPLNEVIDAIWRRRSMRNLCAGIVLLLTMALGLGPWYAAFMMRSHHMSASEVGVWLGLIFGLGGVAGTLAGGYVTARWLARDERAQLRVIAITIASMLPCYGLFLLLPAKHAALAALVPLAMVFTFFLGPTFAILQRLVADEMRATMMAIVMLLGNLVGMGVGPLAVGLLSDRLTPALGEESLRCSMLLMSLIALWAAWHFWRAGLSVSADLAAALRGRGGEDSGGTADAAAT